jgi:hypothetical protein
MRALVVLALLSSCVPIHRVATYSARTCPPQTLVLGDFAASIVLAASSMLAYSGQRELRSAIEVTGAAAIAAADTWAEATCGK